MTIAEPHALPVGLRSAPLGMATFDGHVHTSRDPDVLAAVAGQRVLVVVGGPSAGPLAVALWEAGASVSLSVDRPVVLLPDKPGHERHGGPKGLARHLGYVLLKRYGQDLRPWGLEAPGGDPQHALATKGAWPLVGAGVVTLVRQGSIFVFPGVAQIAGHVVTFSDGRRDRFDRIVLAGD